MSNQQIEEKPRDGKILTPYYIKCSVCTEKILKIYTNQKYCQLCSILRNKAMKRKWQLNHYAARYVARICPVCTELFQAGNKKKKYCRRECQKKMAKITVIEKTIIKWQNQLKVLRYVN